MRPLSAVVVFRLQTLHFSSVSRQCLLPSLPIVQCAEGQNRQEAEGCSKGKFGCDLWKNGEWQI